jgi:glutaredoxin
VTLTIYSRPGCHLCDDMKAVVKRVVQDVDDVDDVHDRVSIKEVDISTDPALGALYGLEIPVLLIDGKKVAKYRVTEDALKRLLADRMADS